MVARTSQALRAYSSRTPSSCSRWTATSRTILLTCHASIAACEDGADLALGSRWVDGGGTVNWGLLRRLISRGGSLYARLVLGVRVRDLTGGFKCFRRAVLESIDREAIAARGYGFQIEGTYRALRKGFRVVEVPIRFVDRRVGQSKMSGSIVVEAMLQVPALRWKALRGRL